MNNRSDKKSSSEALLLDGHVHMVGNGLHGSGCKLSIRGRYRLLAEVMLYTLGLPRSALRADLEAQYVTRLLQMLGESSLHGLLLLAHDHPRDTQGKVVERADIIHVPNDLVVQIGKENPGLLPAVSIHPCRPDAVDELDRCVAAGAVMMKCLPNVHNIDCSNPRYREFWERMAFHRIPLLAHTGGELSLPVVNPAYADPRTLELPLSCGVAVIAAHCGTSSLWRDPDYTDAFRKLTQRHPNLYGDNSGMMTPIRSRHLPRLLRDGLAQRVVHGSDLPIPFSGRWPYWRGLVTKEEYRRLESLNNPLERDLQLKLSMGFPVECFTRLEQLLPLSAERKRQIRAWRASLGAGDRSGVHR